MNNRIKKVSFSKTLSFTEKSISVESTRLHGVNLFIARGIWGVLTAISTGQFIAATYIYYFSRHGAVIFERSLYTTSILTGYASLIFQYMPLIDEFSTFNITLMNIILLLGWYGMGLFIFWQRSNDKISLLASLSLILLGTNFTPSTYLLVIQVGPTSIWGVFIIIIQALSWSLFAIALALFPDGHFVPNWTRWLVLGYAFCQIPLSIPANWSVILGKWSLLILGIPIITTEIVLLAAQIYRYLQVSNTVQRQQTKWVLFALIIAIPIDVVNILPTLIFPSLKQTGPIHTLYILFIEITFPFMIFIIPFAIGFAILRYRLWDVDLLINRTIVYGLLTICIISAYLVIVVGFGSLFAASGNIFFSILATAFIAIFFHPMRQRMQHMINRLMFGDRDEPYHVLLRLGQQLESTMETEKILPIIVETVAQTLKLPFVAISRNQDEALVKEKIVASYGDAENHKPDLRIPLIYQQEQIGELLLAPRSPGEALTHGDLRLLHDLTRQISIAVHAVQLTHNLQQLTLDLQQSRERLVLTREEERRRLRRDLHDGLGPRLAGMTLKLETARNFLSYDPKADPIFSQLITYTQDAIADVRRLIYALRPPALDELGLLPALYEQMLQYSDFGEQSIHISLESQQELPPLPAAIEVALFRIAQEAMTNAVRHSQANRCVITLSFCENEQMLEMTIMDNGLGLPKIFKAGMGLNSMHERAEELGGTWVLEQPVEGGTRIVVRLPYTEIVNEANLL